MLWLLLLGLVFAPTGLSVDTASEVNVYSDGSNVWLNFTAYANVPELDVEPGAGIEDAKFYNIMFSEGATIHVYDANTGDLLCEATATIRDDDGKYWGKCILPLDEGSHLIRYNITHENYSAPIVGYKKVRVNKAGSIVLVTSSVNPLGVDVGALLVSKLDRLSPDVWLWIILLMLLMGSALYYRGEQLATGIFDLLFPKLPRPKADLGWAPGMTPTGPLFAKIKSNMGKLGDLFTKKNHRFSRLLNVLKKNPVLKQIVPERGVPEAMSLLVLAVADKISQNIPNIRDPKYRVKYKTEDGKVVYKVDRKKYRKDYEEYKKKVSQYKELLEKISDKLEKIGNVKEEADLMQAVAELDTLLVRLSRLEMGTEDTTHRARIHNPATFSISKEAETLRRMVKSYVGHFHYVKGYDAMIQKFYPGEMFANFGKMTPESLIRQLRDRQYFAEKWARKLGKVGLWAGVAADKATGLLAYTAGMAMKPPGMILFWAGKTTRQLGVMLHQVALPAKIIYHANVDPAEARIRAEKAREERDQAIKEASSWTTGDGLAKWAVKRMQQGDLQIKEGKTLEGWANKTLGMLAYGAALFPVSRWAVGLTYGAIWAGFKAQYKDVRWWFFSPPISKELRPESTERMVNDALHKATDDAVKLIYLDRVQQLLEKGKLPADLHKRLYQYFELTPHGSGAHVFRAEINRLFKQLESKELKPLVDEINKILSIASIHDIEAKTKALKDFLSGTAIKGTYMELANLVVNKTHDLLHREIETKEGAVALKDILKDDIKKANISVFEAVLNFDKEIRQESAVLGREWGIFDKNFQAPTSSDQFLSLAHNFTEDETFWINAAALGSRLGGDFIKGVGAAIAVDIQYLHPITETWINARMLGYKELGDFFGDDEIDLEIKKTALAEMASQLGIDLEKVNDPAARKEYDEKGLGSLADLFAEMLSHWTAGNETYTPIEWHESLTNLWREIPNDPNYLEMHEALYQHAKPHPTIALTEDYVRKRALSDLHDLKETFIKGLEKVSPSLTREDIMNMFSDENKLGTVLDKDPLLSTLFNVYADPALEEGFASSRFRLNVVNKDELLNATSSLLDTHSGAEWIDEQLRGENLTLNRTGIPLIAMPTRGESNLFERSAVLQSFLQYKKGVHSQNMKVTLHFAEKQFLEAQNVAADPYGAYADQLPTQMLHMVSSLMATKRILETKGIDVKLEDISIQDMKHIIYGKERYKVEVDESGKLRVEESEEGNIAGHGGELYNLPAYSNFMIVTRNDEAMFKPLLYGEKGPAFVEELKSISRDSDRIQALVDEEYLSTVTTERLSAADTIVNVEMLRWDPVKKTYVPDESEERYLPPSVYQKIRKDMKQLEEQFREQMQQEIGTDNEMDMLVESLYLFSDPGDITQKVDLQDGLKDEPLSYGDSLLLQMLIAPAKGLAEKLSLTPLIRELPADLQPIAKQAYKSKQYAPEFDRLYDHLKDRASSSFSAKLMLEYLEWKKSGMPFQQYHAQKRQFWKKQLQIYHNIKALEKAGRKEEAKEWEKHLAVPRQYVERLDRGDYLAVMDKVSHNEWLGVMGLIASKAANKPRIMRRISRSYIIDEVERAKERVAKPPTKRGFLRKLGDAIKRQYYKDVYFAHLQVQYLFLPYAMQYEKADHGSSIAQLNYPAAQYFYDHAANFLIDTDKAIFQKIEGLMLEREKVLAQLQERSEAYQRQVQTLQEHARKLLKELKEKHNCKRCTENRIQALADAGDPIAQEYVQLQEQIKSIEDLLALCKKGCDAQTLSRIVKNVHPHYLHLYKEHFPELARYIEIEQEISRLNKDRKQVLRSLYTIYTVDKTATEGFMASAWVATTRSAEKIWSSMEDFGRGGQIAADFHAGSGLYYPTYIWWAQHAADVYQSVAGMGSRRHYEYMSKGYAWDALPVHEISLSDLIRANTDERLQYRLLVEKEFGEGKRFLPGQMWLGAAWRTMAQPFLLGSIAERAIFHYGISGHARLAESRQLYQAYMKSMHYTSALDVNYLASEEEIERLISQLPLHMQAAMREQIRAMVSTRGYYSAKSSNIIDGIGPSLVLQHLGAMSPFNPRTLRDNQQFLSFALHTVGMPFALPMGWIVDNMEVWNRYRPLMYRHTMHGWSALASARVKHPVRRTLGSIRPTEGMGVSDWEERIGYYLIPATKYIWYSPTVAKRSDLPGYGSIELNTGERRMESWLPRMYLGREDAIYETNRTYISWVARWRAYREERVWYSPQYNIYQSILNPFYGFEYFRTARTRKAIYARQMEEFMGTPSPAQKALGTAAKAALGVGAVAAAPVVVPTAAFIGAVKLSNQANRGAPTNPVDRCPVCGSPKRRGMRCPRCGAP